MDRSEIKTRPTAQIDLPVQFSRLRDIAYNLWWSWSPQAISLFEMIDPWRWERYRNPIELLIDLEPERWHELQNTNDFIRAYRSVVERFDRYVAPVAPTWFQQQFPDHDGRPVVYFSTEYGWHECLRIYSGGLGILSGDHSKAASDLGLPFLGIGLMYRHGYFRQTVDADGQQQHFYFDSDPNRVPLLPVVNAKGRELRLTVEFPGRMVQVRLWKAEVGRATVLLLDTDIAVNHPADRPITSILYVSGREMRLCQEMILGIGGVRALRALDIVPAAWHMNEGHSSLLSLERLRDGVKDGESLDDALARIGRNTVFTTHTPVTAGNETFDLDLARRYLSGWAGSSGLDLEWLLALGNAGADAANGSLNLTALALRSSVRTNGVSAKHGQVAGQMWNQLLESLGKPPVEHITNGAHQPTWVGPEMGDLLRRHVGRVYDERPLDPGFAETVEAIPDEEVWAAHRAQKQRLFDRLRQSALRQLARHGRSPEELRLLDHLLDPEALSIGFARRFATYKRADLILRDVERLKKMVADAERPVQFLFAGKAHPADRPGQELIRRIWHASLQDELHGRVLFLENYDMHVARYLVQGVDVWLNTPRRPLEASGTSGMKSAMNGGLNCSILDGWWCEGYDGSHGWAIGDDEESSDHEHQDYLDAESLYHVLGEQVVPCFYQRDERGLPAEWIRRMKLAIGSLTPRFTAARMVRDYIETYYMPAARREL
jgi:starch phosphorylase